MESSNTFEPVDTYELCFLLRRVGKIFNLDDLEREVFERSPEEFGSEPRQSNPEQYEFFVMYSSERESLEVQLYSDVRLNAERSDFLSVQVVQFSFREGSVNLEISDKMNSGNQKARFLTYRAHSCFINKEPLLPKLLLMLDTLMVVRVLTEKYFQTTSIQLEMDSIHSRVEHYLTIVNGMHDKLMEKLPKRRVEDRKR